VNVDANVAIVFITHVSIEILIQHSNNFKEMKHVYQFYYGQYYYSQYSQQSFYGAISTTEEAPNEEQEEEEGEEPEYFGDEGMEVDLKLIITSSRTRTCTNERSVGTLCC
jgi:hypothetical protein